MVDADLSDDGRNGTTLRILTPTIFFPLIAEEIGQDIAASVVDAHFDAENEFATPFPVPSVAVRDAVFYPGTTLFIWRGPTWAFINWFLYRLLKQRGFDERAARVRQSLQRLTARSGFREYYHPYTGYGEGARQFTWSGLLLDMV